MFYYCLLRHYRHSTDKSKKLFSCYTLQQYITVCCCLYYLKKIKKKVTRVVCEWEKCNAAQPFACVATGSTVDD